MGNDLYCVRNTPWFVYGVSFMDIVQGRPMGGGGHLQFEEVALPLYFGPEKDGGPTQEVNDVILAEVITLGAWYEGYKPRFYAIDILAITDPAQLLEYLGELVGEGVVQSEPGSAPPP